MAKYCANCGRELPDEAVYCPDCGKKFIPRTKADFPESNNNLDNSDYEFNGPFGSSSKKFEGPFGPHSNRGSYDSNSSTNKDSSESANSSHNPSANKSVNGSGTVSNTGSTSQSSGFFSNMSCGKVCIILFAALLVLSAIGNMMDYTSHDSSPTLFSDDNYDFNTKDIEGKGSIDRNEPYNMSIDENTYLSGKGEVRLIDSNHSYNIESEEFTITDYETFYINVDNDDWYVLNIFKCKFDTPAQSQVYAPDMDDGDPIIVYGGKGDYNGYGIIMTSSSDDSKFKNLDFLESIFHYKKE